MKRRRGIGARNIKDQTVGEDAGRGINREIATGQGFPIDLERLESPRMEIERIDSKLKQILVKNVLGLEILRRKKCPFCPDYRLESSHTNW